MKSEGKADKLTIDDMDFFFQFYSIIEFVYVTIGNPTFCLAFYLTGVHFQGELHHVGHVGERKIKFRSIRTRKVAGVRL